MFLRTPFPVPTAPAYKKELAAKQAEVDALNTKLDDLYNQAEIAAEEFNKASLELTATTAQVDAAQNDLNNTRAALVIQDEILSKRVASIYRDGNLTTFEVLLDAKSVGDFIGRVKFLNTIGLSDANKAAGLKAQNELMTTQLQELQAAQARAQELAFELKAREGEVKLRTAEQQLLLESAKTDIRELIEEEAAKRTGQQSALLSQVLSGTDKAGIDASPGSPVETALAYHGVPYVWGGASPSGLDCSGLVLYVFEQHGVVLPALLGLPVPARREDPAVADPAQRRGVLRLARPPRGHLRGRRLLPARTAHRRLRQAHEALDPRRHRWRPSLPVGPAHRPHQGRQVDYEQRAELGALDASIPSLSGVLIRCAMPGSDC